MKIKNLVIAVVSGLLIISSVEARDHESHRERKYHDRDTEEEIIIIKKTKHKNIEKRKSHNFHRHLPSGYRRFRVHDRHYYYHHGIYYKKCRGGYEIVEAPRTRHLPRHSRKVSINSSIYFVYDNVYYRPHRDYYVVCEPPPPPLPSRPRHRDSHRKDGTVRFNINIGN